MKVIIENNIPYIKGLLEPYCSVEYLPNSEIDRQTVADADALFVRTRTKCNRALLDGSRVRFIATATIGTDHIDMDYCRTAGIAVYNAPGCNAPAVAQYVFSVIGTYLHGNDLRNAVLGVVGVGHVGSIVARWGRRLGMTVLECDPPRQRAEQGNFVSLETIAHEAHIITFHTPLNRLGDDCTLHLANASFFNSLRRFPLLINSSRGAVVDNEALIDALDERLIDAAAIDCWENEPNINTRLLEKAFIATPHIAGYSLEGKRRATAMTLEAFGRFFGIEIAGIPTVEAPLKGADITSIGQVTSTYNPLVDTAALKRSPDLFESLRNSYALRSEVR